MSPNTNYQKLFVDIGRGYSIVKHKTQTVYLKHFSAEEQLIIDSDYQDFLEKAKRNGLPSKEEVIKRLIKDGFWSEEDQKSIEDYKRDLGQLFDRKKSQILQSKIKEIDEKIKAIKTDLKKKETELISLIGICAEFDASQRINETYIKLGFFKDSEFKLPLINADTIDWLDSDDIMEMIGLYNENNDQFSEENIKRLAIQDFFLNYFFLTDDVGSFFGRAIYKLTFLQMKLGTYGRYFKSIYENHDLSKVSPEIKNDPDRLIDYISTRKNAEEVINKADQRAGNNNSNKETVGHATAIMGATKEDIEHLNSNDNGPIGPDPFEAAKRNGGELSLEQYVKLMAGR